MLRRTLAVLTPVLFALPLLLTPASQVYADADMDGSVYSGLECKYLDSYAMEGQMMAGGDVVYNSRLGIGNGAERSRDEADPSNPDPSPNPGIDPPPGDTKQYRMKVACPLPSLDGDDEVMVAVIDGTVFDYVQCWIESCDAGLGLQNGEGGCEGGYNVNSRATNHLSQPPYTQPEKYITQNVDWLNLMAPPAPNTRDDMGRENPESGGMHASSLICILPEQDDESPEAPNVDGDDLPQGISYIQSYYVK